MLSIDINPVAFYFPFTDHPVTWYGISFATGLLISLQFAKIYLRKSLQAPKKSPLANKLYQFVDRQLLYIMIGILVGARGFEVLFYSPEIISNGFEVLQTWHGGLSSHGGVLGAILALLVSAKINKREIQSLHLTPLKILDVAAVASGPVSFMIRLGNFINQEIIGTTTSLPWAVIFEGADPSPRHPVQLYEGFFYLFIWVWASFRFKKREGDGILCADVLLAIFCCRFLLEFFKAPLTAEDHFNVLQIGQWLSLPAIALCLGTRLYLAKKTKAKQ